MPRCSVGFGCSILLPSLPASLSPHRASARSSQETPCALRLVNTLCYLQKLIDLADTAAGFLFIRPAPTNNVVRNKQPRLLGTLSRCNTDNVFWRPTSSNSSQRWQQLATGDRSDICPPLSPPNSSTSLPLVPRPETKAGDLCAPCKVARRFFLTDFLSLVPAAQREKKKKQKTWKQGRVQIRNESADAPCV